MADISKWTNQILQELAALDQLRAEIRDTVNEHPEEFERAADAAMMLAGSSDVRFKIIGQLACSGILGFVTCDPPSG